MANITHMFLLKVHPPTGATPATLERAKTVMTPGSLTTATSVDPAHFDAPVAVKAGESWDATVESLSGVCELIVVPLGWPAGGCGGRSHTPLGDSHIDTLRELAVYAPAQNAPAGLRTLKKARLSYSGDGLLTCSVHGVQTQYNLHAEPHRQGLCVAVVLRDAAAKATVTIAGGGVIALN